MLPTKVLDLEWTSNVFSVSDGYEAGELKPCDVIGSFIQPRFRSLRVHTRRLNIRV